MHAPSVDGLEKKCRVLGCAPAFARKGQNLVNSICMLPYRHYLIIYREGVGACIEKIIRGAREGR
jgi:hypothetical protein